MLPTKSSFNLVKLPRSTEVSLCPLSLNGVESGICFELLQRKKKRIETYQFDDNFVNGVVSLPEINRRCLVGETWEWHEGATIFCCSDSRPDVLWRY